MIILDTHVWVWWIDGSPQFPSAQCLAECAAPPGVFPSGGVQIPRVGRRGVMFLEEAVYVVAACPPEFQPAYRFPNGRGTEADA